MLYSPGQSSVCVCASGAFSFSVLLILNAHIEGENIIVEACIDEAALVLICEIIEL